MSEALRVLREHGAAGCVVLGEPGLPPEYFQAVAFGASEPKGIFSYHAAFAASA
jgi:predicted N-acetyltransferase YhbS